MVISQIIRALAGPDGMGEKLASMCILGLGGKDR